MKKEKKPKICLVSSSGGHFEQIKRLKPLLEKYEGFFVTEKTKYKADAKYYLSQTGSNDFWFFIKFPWMVIKTFFIWLKERPDFVITTGTIISFPFYIMCKIFRKKFVYIETFARVYDGTRAGKKMYKKADLFIYQWEQLKDVYPDGVYGGSIY